MLGDSKCHCTTLTISHHSSSQLSGEPISSALYLSSASLIQAKAHSLAQHAAAR